MYARCRVGRDTCEVEDKMGTVQQAIQLVPSQAGIQMFMPMGTTFQLGNWVVLPRL